MKKNKDSNEIPSSYNCSNKKWKYCETVTTSHPLVAKHKDKIVRPIVDILKRERCTCGKFENQKGIDAEKLRDEENKNPCSQEKSVDLVIGLKSRTTNGKRLLHIDCKCNSHSKHRFKFVKGKHPKNFDKNQFDETRDMLKNGSIVICNTRVLLYLDTDKEKIKNYNRSKIKAGEYEVYLSTPSLFYEHYFQEEQEEQIAS